MDHFIRLRDGKTIPIRLSYLGILLAFEPDLTTRPAYTAVINVKLPPEDACSIPASVSYPLPADDFFFGWQIGTASCSGPAAAAVILAEKIAEFAKWLGYEPVITEFLSAVAE